jgi:hypothetical protein
MLNSMVFSDLKVSIKACDSDNCIINDLLKTLKSLISESSLDNWEEFMIKGVIKKYKSQRDEDHTQEINPKQSIPALIPIEKLKWLLKVKCVHKCQQKLKHSGK